MNIEAKLKELRDEQLSAIRERAPYYKSAFGDAGLKILERWVQEAQAPTNKGDLYELGKADGKREIVQEILLHLSIEG
jgi:hypothetical protein